MNEDAGSFGWKALGYEINFPDGARIVFQEARSRERQGEIEFSKYLEFNLDGMVVEANMPVYPGSRETILSHIRPGEGQHLVMRQSLCKETVPAVDRLLGYWDRMLAAPGVSPGRQPISDFISRILEYSKDFKKANPVVQNDVTE